MVEQTRGSRKTRVGAVAKDSKNKTVVVITDRMLEHKKYKKIIRRSKKLYVHDELGQCKSGDIVKVVETRPLSKTKRWRYLETIKKATKVEGQEQSL